MNERYFNVKKSLLDFEDIVKLVKYIINEFINFDVENMILDNYRKGVIFFES